jgi:hypothetical protein
MTITDTSDVASFEKEYCNAFSTAETHLKNAEYLIKSKTIKGGVVIPAINELRYAGYHAALALDTTISQENKIELYKKAIGHCERSSYDSLDALFQFGINQCTIFREDYKLIVISEIIPDYLNDCQRLEKIKNELIRQEDKKSRWQNIEKHLNEVLSICEKWNIAREELNKRARATILKIIGAIIGIIGTFTGILMYFR